MMKIKANTKKAITMLKNAERNEGYYLTDVYNSTSEAKINAWKWCFNQYANDENAHNFRIISHNTFAFSVAWDITDNDGVYIATRIETSNNSYYVEVA